jgi:hypothetical protein
MLVYLEGNRHIGSTGYKLEDDNDDYHCERELPVWLCVGTVSGIFFYHGNNALGT